MAATSAEVSSSLHRWIAVWTKPRQEERAEENLRRQGFEVVLPRVRERRSSGRRTQWRLGPLFPRYVFAGADLSCQSLAPIRSTVGCIHPVYIAGRPAFVPQPVIEQLRSRGERPLVYDRSSGWQRDQHLHIVDGPFAGLTALFQAHTDEERVEVLLQCLGQWQRLTLPTRMLDAPG